MESKNQVNYERLSLITGCGFFGVFTAFTTAQSLATSLPGTLFDDEKKRRNDRSTKNCSKRSINKRKRSKRSIVKNLFKTINQHYKTFKTTNQNNKKQEDPQILDTFVLQHFTERFVSPASSFRPGSRKSDPSGVWCWERVRTF